MRRRNGQIGFVTVPDASHYVHDDAPELFIQHLRRFLGQTGPHETPVGLAP
jgi:pimeloyl-ACP methyl ester carboxylesterase